MITDEAIWQEFAAESAEHLDALEHDLPTARGQAAVNDLFRAMHSLKGMAGALGARGMQAVAHRAEDLLGLARQGRLELTAAPVAALLTAVDALRAQREALLTQRQDLAPPADLLTLLGGFAGEEAPTAPMAASAAVSAAPSADPLLATLASLLAQEVPGLPRDPALAATLATGAREAGLDRLGGLLEEAASGALPAAGRLRAALRLLAAQAGAPAGEGFDWPGRADPARLLQALEADAAAALLAIARDTADAALATGDAALERAARAAQDAAARGDEALTEERRAALRAGLLGGEAAPAANVAGLPPALAAVLPPPAQQRAAAALAAGQRIWRLRLGPLSVAEAAAEPFLRAAGEVLGSAGPPEALDIFFASAVAPEELAARRAEADPEGAALADLSPADAPPPAATMRIRQDRVDAVINFAAEARAASLALTEAQNAPAARRAVAEIAALQKELPPALARRLARAVENLRGARGAAIRAGERLSVALGQLDEAVLELRVVPFATLANRVPRAVHMTAGRTGKTVRLTIEGQDVQLDRALADLLSDPLLHLVRNAVDHGVESPRKRLAAGKPSEALLLVRAERQGGRLLLTVADDGAGIDTEAARARAEARGLIRPGQRLSEEETHALLFVPGFSTRTEVSETSGRGVGLDVVAEAARRAGGTVRIESARGSGTRFLLDMPLSAALQPVLLVEAGGHPYALPAGRVQSVSPTCPAELTEIRLDAVLRLPPAPVGGVVILKRPAGTIGLAVERVLRRTDLLLKPLHPALAATPGVGGVGVLGNGDAVLLLEPDGFEAAL
jgi:two-component system chemotaxis sensor kinase CheA